MAENFVNLSEVIKSVSPRLQSKYVNKLKEATSQGEIDSVPVEVTFELRGKSYREHVVLNDERYEAWHQQTMRDFELSAVRGALAYAEDLKSGKVDFKARAEEYRKTLRKQQRRSTSRPKKDRLAQVVTETDKGDAPARTQANKAKPDNRNAAAEAEIKPKTEGNTADNPTE